MYEVQIIHSNNQNWIHYPILQSSGCSYLVTSLCDVNDRKYNVMKHWTVPDTEYELITCRAEPTICYYTDLDISNKSTQEAFSWYDAILENGPAAPQ
jgi:hypothetical protein